MRVPATGQMALTLMLSLAPSSFSEFMKLTRPSFVGAVVGLAEIAVEAVDDVVTTMWPYCCAFMISCRSPWGA